MATYIDLPIPDTPQEEYPDSVEYQKAEKIYDAFRVLREKLPEYFITIGDLPAGNGILVRTGTNTWELRTLQGTANEITVTNGDGQAGNPVISLPAALTFTGKTITGGTYSNAASIHSVGAIRGGAGTGNGVVYADGASGFVADFGLLSGTSARWLLRKNATLESGANAGSDFEIHARNDAGGSLGVVLSITRAAGGNITFARPLAMGGNKITGLAAATVNGDAVRFEQINGVYQPIDATLTALAAYNTNGILTQTAADTFAGRTLTGTANEITVTNGNGVAGNPTVSLPAALTFTGKTITGGSYTGVIALDFGSATAASPSTLTRHIALFGTTYGFSITSNQLNYVAPLTADHVFHGGTTEIGRFDNTSMTFLASTMTLNSVSVLTTNTGVSLIASGSLNTGGDTTFNIPAGTWGPGKLVIYIPNAASADYVAYIRFNNDSGNNYSYAQSTHTSGSGVTNTTAASVSAIAVTKRDALTDNGNFCAIEIDIPAISYAGSSRVGHMHTADANVTPALRSMDGTWFWAGGAITSIQILLRNTVGTAPTGSTINGPTGATYRLTACV